MSNYVLNETIPLNRANYINEMTFAEFKKFCTRCENDYERQKLYNKVKTICNDTIIHNGSIVREYKFSATMGNYGRLSSNGLQGVMREFRGFLMGENTTDLDQVNSHPVILSYLCHKHNIQCDALDEYNSNREGVLASFHPVSRADAKTELLKSINRDQHNKNNKNPFYKKWDKEIQRIQTELLQVPEYKVIFDTVPVDKEYNRNGSKISRILCHHENLILQVALDVLLEGGYEIATLMADGCMIYGNHYNDTELLQIVKNACNEKFEGLNMDWTYKPHCQDIQIPDGWICKRAIRELALQEKEEYDNAKKHIDFKDYIPFDVSTDVGIAKFIVRLFPDKFIWIKDKEEKCGVMYSWTGKRWECGKLEFLRFLSGEFIDKINEIRVKVEKEVRRADCKMATIMIEILSNLEKTVQIRSKQLSIIDSTEPFLINETIKFDNNADIIGFNNGVYDLISHEFRPTRYSDYITMSCGYNYNDNIDPEKLADMDKLIKTIIPDEETRNLMLEILSAGLTGRVIEKFVLFNGIGRNGKGLIDELSQMTFGEYCLIYANVSLLTEKEKTGGNPEKATIDSKRLVIMKEPLEDEAIHNSNVKGLTGGGNVAGRMLYSNKTIIRLCMILIMECNTRPKFKSDPGSAEEDRVIDILFPNRFTEIDDEIDNVSTFKADSKYKTLEWKESHRDAFLQILISAFKNLQKNNYVLTIPKVVKTRTDEYLNQSFPILQLFNESYTKTGNKNDTVKLKDVFAKLKTTDTYIDFTKEMKRKFNYKYFCEFFKTHRNFRADFVDKNQGVYLVGYSKMFDVIEDQDIITGCVFEGIEIE